MPSKNEKWKCNANFSSFLNYSSLAKENIYLKYFRLSHNFIVQNIYKQLYYLIEKHQKAFNIRKKSLENIPSL